MTDATGLALSAIGLTVRDRSGRTILDRVNLDVPDRMITCVIGPSGAGKSTLLRCLNRLVDLTTSLEVEGRILFEGRDIRERGVDVDDLRRRIGTVFQQPVVFPGSIRKNVVFAARTLGLVTRRTENEILESCLRAAGLWSETKDRLDTEALKLSVGQQQRLAIARTLAGDPDIILMDEPTSALDQEATAAFEETVHELRRTKTIVLVTHQLPQAERLGDWIAC
ncbi:MAG: ATP-binding cassette domain-containing protein, partial [Thermoanaerobaculia bacterium]|nr:ATP-binding cassette domain-containing protein [Thermoanaerobaculia bacterium]